MSEIRIEPVVCLTDNYAYIVYRHGSQNAVVIDPSEAPPLLRRLKQLDLRVDLILNTHHHHDHVGGNEELATEYAAPVWCSEPDVARVPGARMGLHDNQVVERCGIRWRVLFIPGHTRGQVAYWIEESGSLFVGDTVFSMGCGRLLEGTPKEMWQSLQRLKALPPETRMYFGHEYTARNAAFAKTFEPLNEVMNELVDSRLEATQMALKVRGYAEAPPLFRELEVNPFFRAKDLQQFTELRAQRDKF